MTHAKIFPADIDSFTNMGKTCLARVLLETERMVFGSTEDNTFAEGSEDYDSIVSDREKRF